jgi:hypothetical protein
VTHNYLVPQTRLELQAQSASIFAAHIEIHSQNKTNSQPFCAPAFDFTHELFTNSTATSQELSTQYSASSSFIFTFSHPLRNVTPYRGRFVYFKPSLPRCIFAMAAADVPKWGFGQEPMQM